MADSRIIKVGADSIGIKGLDKVLDEMAGEFAEGTDQEVAREMLARLEPRNYLAPSALDEYAAAFVREFRRRLGQPQGPETGQGLEVKILGPGCPRCEELFQRVAKVLAGLGLAADLEAVKDAKSIAATGVLATPGLMINGKVLSSGKAPGEDQIRRWLEDINN